MNIILYVIVLFPICCQCFLSELSLAGIASIASLYAGLQYSTCWFNNCCKKFWYEKDFDNLRKELKRKLYGQHIAEEIVVNHLKAHFLNQNPKKALVLSLHGTTGSGKNYITGIALKYLLPNGMKDKNVKLWNAKYHFSNTENLEKYQVDLRKKIHKMTSACPRAIFIFDEANELPSGLLDVLKPMMDEYEELDGVDYRQTTFFFLSNTGAVKINQVMLQSKKEGRERTSMKLGDFQPLIQDGSFNEEGGFLKSKLIEKNLIDSYVPFLPLEEEHVKMCIKYYLQTRRCIISDVFIDTVSKLVNYEPSGYKYFSSYGCRGVDNYIKQEIDDPCIYNNVKDEL